MKPWLEKAGVAIACPRKNYRPENRHKLKPPVLFLTERGKNLPSNKRDTLPAILIFHDASSFV